MNKLKPERQALVLSQLVEGNSIRATERITGVHQNTIMSLLVRTGERASEVLDQRLVNLRLNYVQVDEIWAFVGKKQKRVDWIDEQTRPELGDTYTYIAIDAETKLVPAFHVGKRDTAGAMSVLRQLRDRSATQFQLSSDSFLSYKKAVRDVFGRNIDYGQIHKNYREAFVAEKRYSPAKLIGITLRVVYGDPDTRKISTSYIERQNLTVRMGCRRFTRLTNAFSKKIENLEAAVNLHFYHYNFMRVHRSLGTTPAMAAGLTDRVWGWGAVLT